MRFRDEEPISVRVNGQPQRLVVEPRVTLVDALRDRLYEEGLRPR